MTNRKIMMLAGEPSGDLHGSNLASELKMASPGIELFGVGGEKMRKAGVNLIFDLKDLAITGLLDVIKNYFRLKKIQAALLSKVKDVRPDLIILIDYPDFNLRFAKKVKKLNLPVIYYISPQVWAWRKGRIKLIKRYIKKIFVIFKFEEELYKKAGVDVEFVGHPLLDAVRPSVPKGEFLKRLNLYPGKKFIALLPGSRTRLVKTLLPIMLNSGKRIYEKLPDTRFLISKSPSVDMSVYTNELNKFNLPLTLVENNTYDVISAADFVLTISGTSTLETAILGKPMAIIYKLPLLEYVLAKPLLRLKNIGLVNIVAGVEIVPEFLQLKTRPENIAKAAIDILSDEIKYESIKNKLNLVKNQLYPDGASKKAAASILKLL